MAQDFVAVGKVAKPRGLKGEAFLMPLTDFPERYKALLTGRVEAPDGSSMMLYVAYVRQYGPRMAIKFEGFDTPEEVGRFRGYFIQVPRDAVHPLPDDTFYVFEVVDIKSFEHATRLQEASLASPLATPGRIFRARAVEGARLTRLRRMRGGGAETSGNIARN